MRVNSELFIKKIKGRDTEPGVIYTSDDLFGYWIRKDKKFFVINDTLEPDMMLDVCDLESYEQYDFKVYTGVLTLSNE